MKVKWILVLLAIAASGVFAGAVLARSLAGPVATQLGKAVFQDINVDSHTQAVFGRYLDRASHAVPADFWQTLLQTHGLSDVYVVDNKFAAGSTSGWHSHPGPSLILVVSGTVTNYTSDDPTCTPHVYAAGSGFIDQGGDHLHMLRNETGAAAETIAVQILPKDAPRKTDAVPPANCPA
jgi:hypothetical protein